MGSNSDDHDEATCDDCSGPTLSWRAPDSIWNQVLGGLHATDDPGGMLCPNCFIKRAELGGVRPPAWTVDFDRHHLRKDKP